MTYIFFLPLVWQRILIIFLKLWPCDCHRYHANCNFSILKIKWFHCHYNDNETIPQHKGPDHYYDDGAAVADDVNDDDCVDVNYYCYYYDDL